MPRCSECSKHASFGWDNGKVEYCYSHKIVGMVNLVAKYCNYEGCDKRNPAYDYPNGKGTFCVKHKMPGMNIIRNRICTTDGCFKQSSFDFAGGKGAYCSSHKLLGMINIKDKTCEVDFCIKYPVFGYIREKARFCVYHRKDSMIDVKSRHCVFPGCTVRPTFDISGGKGVYCKTHKLPIMVDVKNSKCIINGCNKRPTFNIPGMKAMYCVSHKASDMINVLSKRCLFNSPAFNLQALFDIEGGDGKYCSKHKQPGMIDVCNNHCKSYGCRTNSRYGLPGHSASRCAVHRIPGMLRHPNARCKHRGCKEKAFYGSSLEPIHCEVHQDPTIDRNLVERVCSKCSLTMVLNAEGLCEFCDPVAFNLGRLAKQNAAIAAITAADLTPSSIDIMIDGGVCGRERPDVVFQLPDRVIIVEIDERQHRDRPADCEKTRMLNLGQTFGGLPVVFIRWNPDDYTPAAADKESETITKRHRLLTDFLKDLLAGKKKPPHALVSVIYLYYDGWAGISKQKWSVLTAFEDESLATATLTESVDTIRHES